MRCASTFRRVLPLCAAGLMLWGAEGAAAQQRPAREGFWAAFGLGFGANSMSCGSGCSVNPDAKGGSATASVKMGGTPRPRLRLGGELNLWRSEERRVGKEGNSGWCRGGEKTET